ncbi:NAD(P)/FAD-dependent oxidoreductase [Nocardioides sp.]|uniref:dihydrolipoyl dehydrogenase family protein n=1 Tax=Nocardioides sp. TaxID=35761 RepID=UPI003565195B
MTGELQTDDNGVQDEADDTVDVIVVGMGVAGEAVAGELAKAGLAVVGIEANLVGGECPYWGCIPSKMMIRAADLIAETRRVDGMAGTASVTPDWAPVAQRIREEATDHWNDQVAVDRFVDAGGRFVRGHATIVGPRSVQVEGRTLTARRGIVIGTGTVAAVPPIPGLAESPYWTNREAVETTTLPASLVVIGGGAIGLELAQVFSRFGVEVSVVEVAERLLAAEEPESSALIEGVFRDEGIEVRTGVQLERVDHDGDHFSISLAGGESLAAEKVLVATGRRVDLSGLGVGAVGLDPQARAVEVDERMRAGDGLWAVGDVTGKGAFTHIGTYQAPIAVRDILEQDGPTASYDAVPRVTFTDPEIGSVGLTEAQARDRGLTVRTGLAKVPSTARGWLHKAGNEGLIKVVVDADTDLVVGATAAGPNGGEVLGALAVAVHGQVPVSRLQQMIYAYPTFHRGIEDALRDLDE